MFWCSGSFSWGFGFRFKADIARLERRELGMKLQVVIAMARELSQAKEEKERTASCVLWRKAGRDCILYAVEGERAMLV